MEKDCRESKKWKPEYKTRRTVYYGDDINDMITCFLTFIIRVISQFIRLSGLECIR